MESRLLSRLGATPIPVNAPEAATAVRQGVADSALSPAIFIVATQMYPMIKYVNPAKIRYSPAPIIIALPAWNTLPEKYRKAIWQERWRLVGRFCEGTRRDNEKSLGAMVRYGIKEVSMSPETLAQVRQKSLPLWDEMAGKLYPRELLDELLGYLKGFRAHSRSNPAQ
jgi:TRAP-type C4-dicarboxylate transport system substrate-binding protein